MILDCMNAPWRITLDTNPDLCNIHCVMCEIHSKYNFNRTVNPIKNILDISDVEKIIREAAAIGTKEIIPSTMGEPLLYPGFQRMVEIIRECNLKLNLTTNGTFPKLGVEKWSEIILPVASDVKISINGATKETEEKIMAGINHEKHISDASRFITKRNEMKEVGFDSTVTMQVTFMKSNMEELPLMVRMAIEMGFDRFKGHHLWVTNQKIENQVIRASDSVDRWNEIVDEVKSIAKGKIKLQNIEKLVGDKQVRENTVCPFLGKEAWVRYNGDFEVCCCPNDEREKLGYFGNVKNDGLLRIWNSERYRNFVSGWGSYEPCRHCNMRVDGDKR